MFHSVHFWLPSPPALRGRAMGMRGRALRKCRAQSVSTHDRLPLTPDPSSPRIRMTFRSAWARRAFPNSWGEGSQSNQFHLAVEVPQRTCGTTHCARIHASHSEQRAMSKASILSVGAVERIGRPQRGGRNTMITRTLDWSIVAVLMQTLSLKASRQ